MKALALYGSTARYEREIDSDVDLLGIYDGDIIHQRSQSIVNIFLYPENLIIEKMSSGDLFSLHLVKESLPIFGEDVLNSIFSKFKYKDNYLKEIGVALFISKLILGNYDVIVKKSLANKKLVWCLRTIIIALSAQDKTPVFSKKLLSEYIEIPQLTQSDILNLINTKNVKRNISKKTKVEFLLFFNHIERILPLKENFVHDPLVINTLITLGLLRGNIKNTITPYE